MTTLEASIELMEEMDEHSKAVDDASIAAADESLGPPCADLPLTSRVEALLISTDKPLTEAKLVQMLALSGAGQVKAVREAIAELNRGYEESSRSFRAERLAGGWQILTLPQFGALLEKQHAVRQQGKLSQPALETLAIIAYRQPVMRAEIEAIRGVASGEVLRGLLERRLVKIVGRAEELGRPMLYGTTREFLEIFGLASLDDLPAVEGLKGPRGGRPSNDLSPRREDASVDSAGESVSGESASAAER